MQQQFFPKDSAFALRVFSTLPTATPYECTFFSISLALVEGYVWCESRAM